MTVQDFLNSEISSKHFDNLVHDYFVEGENTIHIQTNLGEFRFETEFTESVVHDGIFYDSHLFYWEVDEECEIELTSEDEKKVIQKIQGIYHL